MDKTNFEKYDTDYFQKLISESTSISEILRKLGLSDYGSNHTKLTDFLKTSNYDTTSLVGRKIKRYNDNGIPKKKLTSMLTENSSRNSNKIKQRLFKEGIKENKCERCGIEHWMGNEITFELHHINGIRTDNRLENLIILCPNCHSQTSNFRGKNSSVDLECLEITKQTAESKMLFLIEQEKKQSEMKKINNKSKDCVEPKKRFCEVCGKELNNKQTKFCSEECMFINARKNIPSKVELLEESYKHNSLESLSKFYNVSATACKKWAKKYEIYDNIRNNFSSFSYPILQFDIYGSLIREWKNADEIEKELGFKKKNIQKACNKHCKTSNGFIWKYKEIKK